MATLITSELAIQAYSGKDALWHLGRAGASDILPLFGAFRRKTWVAAQFSTGQQAKAYAEAHAAADLGSRHRAARIQLLHELLAEFPKGELLDAGCGPGVLVRSLLQSPTHNYQVTVLDRSQAMVRYCVAHADGRLRAMVGDLEGLPFSDASFDVAVATGALEYTHARTAISQLSRVTKPGGKVVVSMLNPLSPYWLTDWFLYRPALRLLSLTMGLLGIRTSRPFGAHHTGIRALRSGRLRSYMRRSGLVPVDTVYFALTPLVSPLDRIPALRCWSERRHLPVTTRGMRRWMATGYVVVAQRQEEPARQVD